MDTSPVRFMDIQSITESERPDLDEMYSKPRFRERYWLDYRDVLPVQPVAYAILHQYHFVVYLQDTERMTVHILGYSSDRTDETAVRQYWNDTEGFHHYRLVCRMNGWPCPDDPEEVTVKVSCPVQNGYDCGVVAIQLVRMLYSRSFAFRKTELCLCRGCPVATASASGFTLTSKHSSREWKLPIPPFMTSDQRSG